MELNVVTRALVDVLVWGLNNSGEKIHSEEIDVVELAQIAEVNLNHLHFGLKIYRRLFINDIAQLRKNKFIAMKVETYYGDQNYSRIDSFGNLDDIKCPASRIKFVGIKKDIFQHHLQLQDSGTDDEYRDALLKYFLGDNYIPMTPSQLESVKSGLAAMPKKECNYTSEEWSERIGPVIEQEIKALIKAIESNPILSTSAPDFIENLRKMLDQSCCRDATHCPTLFKILFGISRGKLEQDRMGNYPQDKHARNPDYVNIAVDHHQLPHAGDINRPYRGGAEDIDRKKKKLAAQVDQKLLFVDMLVHIIIQARLKGNRIDLEWIKVLSMIMKDGRLTASNVALLNTLSLTQGVKTVERVRNEMLERYYKDTVEKVKEYVAAKKVVNEEEYMKHVFLLLIDNYSSTQYAPESIATETKTDHDGRCRVVRTKRFADTTDSLQIMMAAFEKDASFLLDPNRAGGCVDLLEKRNDLRMCLEQGKMELELDEFKVKSDGSSDPHLSDFIKLGAMPVKSSSHSQILQVLKIILHHFLGSPNNECLLAVDTEFVLELLAYSVTVPEFMKHIIATPPPFHLQKHAMESIIRMLVAVRLIVAPFFEAISFKPSVFSSSDKNGIVERIDEASAKYADGRTQQLSLPKMDVDEVEDVNRDEVDVDSIELGDVAAAGLEARLGEAAEADLNEMLVEIVKGQEEGVESNYANELDERAVAHKIRSECIMSVLEDGGDLTDFESNLKEILKRYSDENGMKRLAVSVIGLIESRDLMSNHDKEVEKAMKDALQAHEVETQNAISAWEAECSEAKTQNEVASSCEMEICGEGVSTTDDNAETTQTKSKKRKIVPTKMPKKPPKRPKPKKAKVNVPVLPAHLISYWLKQKDFLAAVVTNQERLKYNMELLYEVFLEAEKTLKEEDWGKSSLTRLARYMLESLVSLAVSPFDKMIGDEGDIRDLLKALPMLTRLYSSVNKWKVSRAAMFLTAQQMHLRESRPDILKMIVDKGPWLNEVFIEHHNSCIARSLQYTSDMDIVKIRHASIATDYKRSMGRSILHAFRKKDAKPRVEKIEDSCSDAKADDDENMVGEEDISGATLEEKNKITERDSEPKRQVTRRKNQPKMRALIQSLAENFMVPFIQCLGNVPAGVADLDGYNIIDMYRPASLNDDIALKAMERHEDDLLAYVETKKRDEDRRVKSEQPQRRHDAQVDALAAFLDRQVRKDLQTIHRDLQANSAAGIQLQMPLHVKPPLSKSKKEDLVNDIHAALMAYSNAHRESEAWAVARLETVFANKVDFKQLRADATGNLKSYKNPSYKKILSKVINESLSEAMISNIDWDKKIKFPLGLDDDEEEAKEGED